MDKCSGLKRLPGGFVRHSARGQSAQLVIDQSQEFLRCPRVALLEATQNLRDPRHGSSLRPTRRDGEV